MKTSATTPRFKEVQESTITIKNVALSGITTLRVDKVTTVTNIVQEINPKTNNLIRNISKNVVSQAVEPLSFELVEVTPKQIVSHRKNGTPSFVLKMENHFYYTEIPANFSFIGSEMLGKHKCVLLDHECRRFIPVSYAKGGCTKVMDVHPHIERYDYITIGYETFNTKQDTFVVIECSNYEGCLPKKKKLSQKAINNTKISLAQFIWNDVEDMKDVVDRIHKNQECNDDSGISDI